MMTKYLKIIFLLAMLFFMTGCSEDEDPGVEDVVEEVNLQELGAGEAEFIIDGDRKSVTNATASLNADRFMLTLQFSDNSAVNVVLDTLREASFTLNSTGAFGSGVYVTSDGTEFGTRVNSDSEATITFTEVDATSKTLSGTFSGTLVNPNDESKVVDISSAAFNELPFSAEQAPAETDGTFTATVDGNVWSAETITAKVVSQVDVFEINGHTENDIDITIFMPADTQPGTYTLTGNGDYVGVVYPAGENIGTHFSTSGELTIVSHDQDNNNIEATYHFEATRTGDDKAYSITEGVFSYEGY